MSWLDAPSTQRPRNWSEQSLDYKLFFIWELSLMAAIVLGFNGFLQNIPAPVFNGAITAGALVVVWLSIANRRSRNWHWPGVTAAEVLRTLGSAVLMAVFLYIAFRYVPRERSSVPMVLFALSIVVMNLLSSLKLVQPSEADFEKHCGDPMSRPPALDTPAKPAEPQWKRLVRGAYTIAFLAVWLNGMAFFYVHGNYVHGGAPHPTATQTATISEHGAIIYLTPEQKQIDELMSALMMAGIPAVLLGGLLAHFVLGVKLFNNRSTPRGIFDSNRSAE